MSAPHGDAAVAPRAFIKLPDPSSSPWAFTDASSRSFLRKWDLDTHARVARFRYTKPFHRMDADEFVRDFFDSDVVNEHFRVLDRAKRWRSVREIVRDAGEDEEDEERDANAKKDEEKTKTRRPIAVASASYAKTPCSAVSMSLFDRLRDDTPEPRITRAGDSDALVRKIEETIDGFAVGDNLRACLVDACDENHETLFSEAEKAEFLFRVFSHLVLGGSMCQYEETLSPYEDVAKAVYKSLVRAVASDVYSATAIVPAGDATKKKTPCRCSRDRTTFRISVTCASTRGAGTSRCGTTRTCRTGRGTKEEKRARVRGRSKVFRKSSAGGRARRRTRLYIFSCHRRRHHLSANFVVSDCKKLGNTVSI